jgi:hypothetical protein
MKREELRAQQAPLKERYKTEPASALITLKASGKLDEGVTCNIETGRALVQALSAVATSLGIPVRDASLTAEGDLDFRGTLGVAKDVPVGFQEIRLLIDLDSDASEAERQKLLELTERYCVVYQTLTGRPTVSVAYGTGRPSASD